MRLSGVPYILGKFLTKGTTFLEISPQSEVCLRSYRVPKWREFEFENFEIHNFGISLKMTLGATCKGEIKILVKYFTLL
jgi:hypothetical protein